MKRRPRTGSSCPTPAAAPPNRSPEVVGFIVAVLRQMDHAANLVVAFFRSVGMMGPHDHSLPDLPREFLMELGALLQVREWHAAGLIDWFDPEGLAIDDMIGQAIGRLKDDPLAVAASRAGTHAMTDMLRIWTERCAPDARGRLDADEIGLNDGDLLPSKHAGGGEGSVTRKNHAELVDDDRLLLPESGEGVLDGLEVSRVVQADVRGVGGVLVDGDGLGVHGS